MYAFIRPYSLKYQALISIYLQDFIVLVQSYIAHTYTTISAQIPRCERCIKHRSPTSLIIFTTLTPPYQTLSIQNVHSLIPLHSVMHSD